MTPKVSAKPDEVRLPTSREVIAWDVGVRRHAFYQYMKVINYNI